MGGCLGAACRESQPSRVKSRTACGLVRIQVERHLFAELPSSMTLHDLNSTRRVRIATEHFSAPAAMGLTSRAVLGMKAASYCPVAWPFRRPRHKDSGGRHEHPFHQTQKVRRHGGRVGPQGPRRGCCRCAASAPRGWPLVDDPLVSPAGRRLGLDRASGGTRHHPGSLDVSAWARGLGSGIWPQRVHSQHVAVELRG
jgi:hypothetical protein